MRQKLAGLFILFFLGSCARQNYFQEDALYRGGKPENLTPPETGYVWATVGKHYQKSKIHALFWGKHYRDVWATPVQVAVLDLTQLHGGLVPSEMGGGLQSTSLAFLNPEGRTFTLRTLDKDPGKSLSPFLRKTFISNIIRDQTSALNPFAPFSIPLMAEAAEIFHTNPEIYYVPVDAPGLGKYLKSFGGKMVMLEEKFVNKQALTPEFGGAKDLIDTKELRKRKKNANSHHTDQIAFARARLFDVLIHDIDRHEGQWNWAEYLSDQSALLYKPVPKDRDYAYYQFADGVIPWLLTRRLLVGHLKPFIHNIPDVGGITYKARDLDKEFLNDVSSEEWVQIAKELQTALNPRIIQQAIAKFPDSVYQLIGKKTGQKLNHRVEQLPQMATEFYKILAKDVTVFGSAKKERFVVQHRPDKSVVVEVYNFPNNYQGNAKQLYQRVFTHPETRKITLKGLGGNDEFSITGKAKKGPKIIINNEADDD